MLLLHLLADLHARGTIRIQPSVYHLHHRLRPDAALDLDFVRRRVAELGWAFFFEEKDTAAFAARAGLGNEAAGRALRYRGVGRVMQGLPGAVAVTAHHADDYLESVLLHLLRGGGRSAFETLPLSARVLGVPILRPLLPFSRAELAALAASEGVVFREDPSNSDVELRRNRLRAQIVPLLVREGLDPGAFWQRFHGETASDARARAGSGPTHVALDRKLLFPLTARQIKRALDLALGSLELSPASGSLVRDLLSACRAREDFRFQWHSSHLRVWAKRSGPLWLFSEREGLLRPAHFAEGSGSVSIRWGGKVAEYALGPGEAAGTWRPGLRVLLPSGGRKDLKKVFQELGVPVPIRSQVPLIWNEEFGLVTCVCLSFWETGADRVYPLSRPGTGEQK